MTVSGSAVNLPRSPDGTTGADMRDNSGHSQDDTAGHVTLTILALPA